MPDGFERHRDAARRDLAAAVAARPLEHGRLLRQHLGLDDETGVAGDLETATVCLATSEAFGGSIEDTLPGAVALELMEEFVRAQSDITTGRSDRDGRETLWMSVGVPLALNAADGMFALAQLSLLRPVPDEQARLLAASRLLDRQCVACWEASYSAVSETEPSLAGYEAVAAGRGCFLALAPVLGALLAGSGSEASERLRPFGRALALLRQLRADYLRLWPGGAGEPGGRERTYPVLWAIDRGRLPAETPATELAAVLEGAGGRQATLEHIQDTLRAVTALLRDSGLPEGGLVRMEDIARYVARRGVS